MEFFQEGGGTGKSCLSGGWWLEVKSSMAAAALHRPYIEYCVILAAPNPTTHSADRLGGEERGKGWRITRVCVGGWRCFQVGIVSYGETVTHNVNLSQFDNTAALVNFVSQLPQQTGFKTMTFLGIDTARYSPNNPQSLHRSPHE